MRITRVFFLLFAISASAVFAQEADLAVEKLGPAEAPPDSDVAYSVTVLNVGPDDAAGVTLTDLVPAGMSYVSATQNDGPAFTCDSAIVCTIALLPAGISANFTFVFHIDSGTEFANIATVATNTLDPNDENNSSIAFTTTGPPAQGDLYLQKSAPASAAPDTDVAFEITLGNAGPSAAENVLLTDNLPAPLTFVSFVQNSGPNMSCGTSTCTLASFPAGATATFTLTGHVPAGTSSGTEFTNTATVTSDNDPLDENNQATTTVTVSSADVSVEKTGPPTAVAGTTITYTITVENNGPDPAQNVVLSDPALCQSMNCSLGTLPVGSPLVFTFDVDVPSGATSWSNTATVTTDSIDPNAANNTSTVNTTITQSADVGVVKSGPGTVVAGTDVSYTVTVTNDGPSDASNVSVTESLPAGTTFVSSTCGSATCNLGTLVEGASVELTFVLHVDANATGPLVNTATVATSTSDPNANNDESSATTAVTQSADVGVVKSGPGTVVAGTDVSYTVTVTNDGPSDASNVSVTESLPAGTTFVSSTCNSTTCNLGTLAAGASVELTFVLHVDVNATGPLVNTATVATSTSDPNANNNESSATTTIAPADLSIAKTADGTTLPINFEATYTIVVTNNGPGTATDVVVTDELPAGTTLESAPANCTGTTTVTCTIGTLAASTSSTIELVVRLPSTPGEVSNTARVESSSTDPTPGNDESTAAITVGAATPAIPTLSPLALAFLALTIATIVVVGLRSTS